MHGSNGSLGVRVIAHRGAPAPGSAENSVAAVSRALHEGADGVEIDVRLSADDVLVCSHAPWLPGRARALVEVASSRSEELLAGFASLDEVLAAVRRSAGSRIVVEAKPVDDVALAVRTACTLAEVLAEAAGGIDVTVSSFDPALLAVIRATCADLPLRTALLGDTSDDATAVVRRAWADGHDEAHLPLAGIRRAPQARELARSLGLPVALWTVNDPADLRWAADLGVDAVITDDVRGARRELRRAALQAPVDALAVPA